MKKILFLIVALLSLFSCEAEKKNFKADFISAGFKHENSYTTRSRKLFGDDKVTEKTYYNANFLHAKINVKNNTGEVIEKLGIDIIVRIKFKSSIKEFRPHYSDFPVGIGKKNRVWDIDETENISFEYLLNYLDNYDDQIFKHSPEKVDLLIYLTAKNAVGLNVKELIYEGEISSW